MKEQETTAWGLDTTVNIAGTQIDLWGIWGCTYPGCNACVLMEICDNEDCKMTWYVNTHDEISVWGENYPEYKIHRAYGISGAYSFAWPRQWKGIRYKTWVRSTKPCLMHGMTEPHRYCTECGTVETY